ncbi:carboxylic ester hydrolase [Favolaschia claudopus]|uniref:Carboxylic ester hydrolase n=1 Tax=Favolaschia claudopus TaxID=2862362 RepID=A0AAW0AKX1_9AGAR
MKLLPYLHFITSLLFLPAVIGSGPIVDLGYAQYQGFVNTSSDASSITTFLGIRYGAPPVGNLRFRAPHPPHYVHGLQQATQQPAQCWQAGWSGTSPTSPYHLNTTHNRTSSIRPQNILSPREWTNVMSEDCLFLSVYYPSDAHGTPPKGKKLPVAVYIHGGGYLAGASSQFRGSDLINESNHGLVAVVIQYRLGLLGFLAGSAVKKDGNPNAGLLDQDFAFRWIQKHISKFGGNPDHVTIWGESAGGGSVFQQLVANDGKTEPQLFKYAIASSIFAPSQYPYDSRIPESNYQQVLAETNCTSLACLRSAPVSALQQANLDINAAGFSGVCVFVPVIDGDFIRQSPAKALTEGKVNGEAVLAVANAREGTIFVHPEVPVTANLSQYVLELFPDLAVQPELAGKIGEMYKDSGTPVDQAVALYGETIFLCATYGLLRAFGGRGFKAQFAIPPGDHGTDLQYYFPSLVIDVPVLNYPQFFNNTVFINAFAQSFTAFAVSGDPNVKLSDTITPKWGKWNTDSPSSTTEMRFNKTGGDEPDIQTFQTDAGVLQRCRFWDGVAELTGH